ncbi:hypothetical protein D3C78_1436460 [compost metagenome]
MFTHLPTIELVEVLHAVFHRRLIRAGLVHAAQHQGLAAGVHAFGDLIVFDGRFHVGGALGFDEFAFERRDFLGVVELDNVHRFLRALRVQRGQHQHVRVELDHVGRKVRDPDRAEVGRVAFAERQQAVVPLLVHV